MLEEALDKRSGLTIKVIVWILIVFATASMVLYGVFDKNSAGSDTIAAEVDDILITRLQVENVVERQIKNSQAANQTLNDFQKMSFRKQALDQLVLRQLLIGTARKEGVIASDKEVFESLTTMDVFQDQGRFSKTKYLELLQQNNIKPASFENERREEIILRKFNSMITLALQKSELVSTREKQLSKIKVNVSFIELNPAVIASTAQATQVNSDEYLKSDENRKKAENYFKQNKVSKFSIKPTAHIRQIFLSATEFDPKKYSEAEQKIKDIRVRLNKENFSTVATQASEDPVSKDKGGDLGFVTEDQNHPAVSKIAFAMKPNEISEPIKTPSGFHIIQLIEKKEGKEQNFEDVKDKIVQDLVAEENTKKLTAEIETLVKEGRSAEVEAKAKQAGLQWKETGLFTLENENVPNVGVSSEFQKAAFALTAEKPWAPQVIKDNGKSYVLKFKERNIGTQDQKTDQLAQYMEQFMEQRRYADVLTSWIEQAKKQGRVKVFLSSQQPSGQVEPGI